MTRLPAFSIVPPNQWLFQELGLVGGKAIMAQEYRKTNRTLNGAEDSIEEFVRQWMLQQLVLAYEYPLEWLGDRIVVESPVFIGSTRCRVDIAISNRRGDPIILIETKSASTSISEMRQAAEQLKSYLSATHSAIYGVATNGRHTVFVEKRSNPNTFHTVEDMPPLSDLFTKGLFVPEDLELVPQGSFRSGGYTQGEGLMSGPDEAELSYPSVDEYVRAFQAIDQYLSSKHREMLKFHYSASDQTLTMTELAQAVGYANYRGGNLQYGRIGKLLCAELDWAYGVGLNILVWFTHPSESPNGQWLLTLREEASDALDSLGWV